MAERQTPPIDPELLRFEAEAQAAAQAETQAEALSEAPSEAQWETLPSRKRKSSCSSDEHEPRAAKKRLSAETWETKRTIITKLYQEEKRPLKEVMEIMQRDYQFSATVKMYKSRIWKWGLDKKLKSDEVLAILIMKAQRDRQRKESVFHIRGQPVHLDNIQRYLKRKPKLMDDFRNGRRPNHQTMAEVKCRSPSPPPEPILAMPTELRNIEQVLTMFRDCVSGQFEVGKWNCTYNESCLGSDGERSIELFERVIASFALVNRCIARGDQFNLLTVLTPSFEILLKIYKAESPILLLRTPALIWYLDRHHRQNLLWLVVNFMSELCKGSEDAMARIWRLLDHTEFSDYQELSLRLYAMLCPQVERQIGSANYLTHILYNDYTDCLYEGKRTNEAEYVLRGHLTRAQATGKQHAWLSDLAFDHNATVTAILEEQGRIEEALHVTINYIRDSELSDEQEALMILQVGVRYSRLGDTNRALSCFEQAFRLAVELDLDERVFLTCAANLEKVLTRVGRQADATLIMNYRLKRLCSFGETSLEYCRSDDVEELDKCTDPDFPEWLWATKEHAFELEPVWRTIPNYYPAPSVAALAAAPMMVPVTRPPSNEEAIFGASRVPTPEHSSLEYPFLLSPHPWTDYSHSPDPSIEASPANFSYSSQEEQLALPAPAIAVSKTSSRRGSLLGIGDA